MVRYYSGELRAGGFGSVDLMEMFILCALCDSNDYYSETTSREFPLRLIYCIVQSYKVPPE